jgi:plastocyanin
MAGLRPRLLGGVALLLGAVAVALLAGGCSGGGTKIGLQAQGLRWSTSNLELKANTKYALTVANKDGTEHNFTFAAAKANKDVEANKSVKLSFTTPGPGTYTFFCKYHRAQMTATVTVT